MKRRILLLFCLIFPLLGRGKDAYSIRFWTVEERLPGSPVTGVGQSIDGYLWLTTPSQLVRFNGRRFCEIPIVVKAAEKVGRISGLFCDSTGGIWVYGTRGFALFRGGLWRAWSVIEKSPSALGKLLGIYEVSKGVICAVTERGIAEGHPVGGEKVYRFTFKPCPIPADDRATLGAITDASVDRNGHLWMTAWNGLIGYHEGVFDDQSMRLPDFLVEAANGVRTGPTGKLWIHGTTGVAYKEGELWTPIGFPENSGMASVLLEGSDGTLWMGNPTGLFRWDGQWRRMEDLAVPGSLSVNQLIEDQEGNIWGACDGGLLSLRKKSVEPLPVSRSGLSGPIYSLFNVRDAEGSVWIGGKGKAVRLKKQDGLFRESVQLDTDVPISAIIRDTRRRIWFGTLGGGLFVKSPDSAPVMVFQNDYSLPTAHTVYTLFETERWGILAGTQQGLMRVTPEGELALASIYGSTFLEPIHALHLDGDGTFWVCCENSGLIRITPNGEKLQIGRAAGMDGFPRTLFRDSSGHLWAGSTSGLFAITREAVIPMGRTAGILDDAILQIAEDHQKRLWLGTQNGLQCVPISELERLIAGSGRKDDAAIRFLRWGPEDGLPGKRSMGGVLPSTSSEDRLWFPFEGGIAVVIPSRTTFAGKPPPVILEEVMANGRNLADNRFSPLKDHRFAPGSRNITFLFAALSPGNPQSIRYRYRVEGFRGWSEIRRNPVISFEWLPPGDYRLEVIAQAGGVWNQAGISYPFTVESFFWQTPGFYITLTVGLAVLAFLITRAVLWHRYRLQMEVLKREEALSQERARISRDIHDDLGNGLSVVATLSELAHNDVEKEAAHRRLDQIYDVASELARNVDEIVWAVNPANDGWEPFISYFEQYTEYFLGNSGLRFHFTRPQELTGIDIAAKVRHHLLLAVREAVGNVLKHAKASQVSVTMAIEGKNVLTVTVADDGVGFDPSVKVGVGHDGLGNMPRRMKEAGGSIEIDSAPGRGTRVWFHVPVSHKVPREE